MTPPRPESGETGLSWLEREARALARRHNEPVLILLDPPPGMESAPRISYLALKSGASAAELKGAFKEIAP
jgi:hypothetical protein